MGEIMKIKIKSTTRLTMIGWLGAALFILGPAASVFFYLSAVRNITSYSVGQISGRIDISIIFAVLALVGYVLLSIGKETISVALSGEDAE